MKKTTTQYKGWKSGVRSQGWQLLQKKDENGSDSWIEEKTIGKVTMQRHRSMTELFWLVNGKKFKKLKEAVTYADSLALSV